MYRGYIALYRKFQEHFLWKERRAFSRAEAWIDILWEARHSPEPEKMLIKGEIMICEYGESLKSTRTWAKRWRWSESKVRRFLALLKNQNQIALKPTHQTTHLTVLNYKDYDPKRRSKRRTADAQATTDNNDKNEKKDKKAYGENFKNVLLADDEHQKLFEKFDNAADWIERLDIAINQHGYKYKSHYSTILAWSRKDARNVGQGFTKNSGGSKKAAGCTDAEAAEYDKAAGNQAD